MRAKPYFDCPNSECMQYSVLLDVPTVQIFIVNQYFPDGKLCDYDWWRWTQYLTHQFEYSVIIAVNKRQIMRGVIWHHILILTLTNTIFSIHDCSIESVKIIIVFNIVTYSYSNINSNSHSNSLKIELIYY